MEYRGTVSGRKGAAFVGAIVLYEYTVNEMRSSADLGLQGSQRASLTATVALIRGTSSRPITKLGASPAGRFRDVQKWSVGLNKFLRAANWIVIAFFIFSVLNIAIAQPSASILSALNLVPFGSALMAVRSDSRNSARWAGLLANGLWALFYIVIAGAAFVGFGGSLIAGLLVLLVAMTCLLNATILWRSLRANA